MKPECSVPTCPRESLVRGLCKRHYHRKRRYGDPEGGPRASQGETCQVPDCGAGAVRRGYCAKHGRRFVLHGDPLGGRTLQGEGPAHFYANLMTKTDECKVWPYGKDVSGYGLVWLDGRTQKVHLLACEAWQGPRPEGREVGHGPCHNPSCWNGAHLSWVTPRVNSGEHKRRDGTATRRRLSEDDLQSMRDLRDGGATYLEIARHLGVAGSTVQRRLHGYAGPASQAVELQ